ncbi:MAG: ABC transporter permease [Bacteroidales bacterium]|nr:ABC transporter permease [Bacteroidales bacterium]
MIDFWSEVFEHIRNRANQTLASCIGVAWGIFIMVVLVGAGNCVEDSLLKLLANEKNNSVIVYGRTISKPMKGGVEGSAVQFEIQDINDLCNAIPEIDGISPFISTFVNIKGENYGNFEIAGVDQPFFSVEKIVLQEGRLLNHRDFVESEKNVIISTYIRDVLFDKKDAIGKYVVINDIPFKVVGIFTYVQYDRMLFTPFDSYVSAINNMPKFGTFVYTSGNKNVKQRIKNFLGQRFGFEPSDNNALYIQTYEEAIDSVNQAFDVVRYFLWFIGISTLVGGIIGIGNIMVANVRERTKEIGVRMAIGATPQSIKYLILGETSVITFLAGAIGISVGWMLLEFIGFIIEAMDNNDIVSPSLDIKTTIFSMIVLLIAGLISGLRPATIASEMKPIEALQSE